MNLDIGLKFRGVSSFDYHWSLYPAGLSWYIERFIGYIKSPRGIVVKAVSSDLILVPLKQISGEGTEFTKLPLDSLPTNI